MNRATPKSSVSDQLILASAAVCISFAPVFVKMLDRDLLGPTAIGFWRTGLGAIILFAWSFAYLGHARVSRKMAGWLVIAGFLFFLDLFLWHRSIIYSGAGMATILANTQVFGTAILSFFIFKERPGLRFVISAIIAMVGVALLAGAGSDLVMSAEYLKGILFGLLTGVVYANYLVTLRYANRDQVVDSVLPMMAWTSLFSTVFFGVALGIEGEEIFLPDWYSLGVLFALAFVAQSLGWWLIARTLPRLEGARTGLILLIQPVLATVWGALLFAEHLTALQSIGAGVTLAMIYFGSTRRQKKDSP